MNRTVISLVAGAAGAAVGVLIGRLGFLDKTRKATITITSNDGACVASTYPQRICARGGNKLEWNIDDSGNCLQNAVVELRFAGAESPLTENRPKDNGQRKIKSKVRFLAPEDLYKYEVWYVSEGGIQYLMEDPEIQIEY